MTGSCGKTALIGAATLALAACVGTPYAPPARDAADVATATFQPEPGSHASLQVMQADSQGCLRSRTEVPGDGDAPLRMAAGRELFFALQAEGGTDACRVVVSFVPDAKARYRLVELKDFPNGVSGERGCGLRIERDAADGKPYGIDARQWAMQDAGFRCVRAVPSDADAAPAAKP